MRKLSLIVFLAAACTTGPQDTADDLGDGKQDSFGRSYDNELHVTGPRQLTIELDKAFQCEITQFGILLGWHNRDRASASAIDFMTFRATILTADTPKAKQKLFMTDGSHRFMFDGRGHSSEHGDGCVAEVAEIFNDTRNAGIALTLDGCKMKPREGGDTIVVSGEVYCSGKGFTPIVFGPPDEPEPDPGAADAGQPDVGEADAGVADEDPPVDPCAGTCSASQACVAGACVTRNEQSQNSFCDPPRASCDADEDQDCADGHACVDGKCRRLTCQSQNTFCDPPRATCDDQDSDCDAGHACVEGLCRRLSCQSQNTFCDPPRAICHADDDCAAEHTCSDGKCKRLTCVL